MSDWYISSSLSFESDKIIIDNYGVEVYFNPSNDWIEIA